MIKRALISVSDKSGIVEFAKDLAKLGIEILSTGGTAQLLREAGIEAIDVSAVTEFPECLDGRVKTLHPGIHGGILAIRSNESHMETLREFNISPIDLVVINLYPFKETIAKEDVTLGEAVENIDIGGPTMLRSAAKNYPDVTVIIDPQDYKKVLDEISEGGNTSYETRYELALKVFQHTSHYDALIAGFLAKDIKEFPKTLTITYEKVQDLRYGENPHQRAAFYREFGKQKGSLGEGKQLQGKELSFNNINDANGALELLKEFDKPTVVAVKHTNPCGIASADTIFQAYQKAYEADPQSIFGGIVAANGIIDGDTAKLMKEIFLEVIIAPDFTQEALDVFKEKKNIRIIQLENIEVQEKGFELKKVLGGILIQDKNDSLIEEVKTVTEKKPSDHEMQDLLFALKVVKHVKSNGIVLVKDQQTVAIGPGQVSRIWALDNAIKNSHYNLEGSVLASDAFFPFRDCVDAAVKAGVTAIIQPGGSVKDEESIKACNEAKVAMVLTGMRHFKH